MEHGLRQILQTVVAIAEIEMDVGQGLMVNLVVADGFLLRIEQLRVEAGSSCIVLPGVVRRCFFEQLGSRCVAVLRGGNCCVGMDE